jgi:hypothetical protein
MDRESGWSSILPSLLHIIAAVAHRVEQQTENLCVAGSSPARGTKTSPLLMAYNRTNNQQLAQLTQLVECQFDSLDAGSSNLSLRTNMPWWRNW